VTLKPPISLIGTTIPLTVTVGDTKLRQEYHLKPIFIQKWPYTTILLILLFGIVARYVRRLTTKS
jgi:hypothetical protein